MLKSRWIYILALILLGQSCQKDVELNAIRLTGSAAMPIPVASTTCFVHEDDIYLFGGRDNQGIHHNDIWKYNTLDQTWCRMPDTPLKGRVSASACVVGDCAYIGLGFSGKVQRDTSYLCDFWEYNLITLEWRRLADFPSNTTVKNCFFATDTTIYAVYGFNRVFTQDVYKYNIQLDAWEKVCTMCTSGVPRAMDVVGATCQSRYFVGTGFNHGSLRFWAEWMPEQQIWIARKRILGAGRNAVACCASDKYIYIACGRHYGDTLTTGYFYNSIQRYSPETDDWEYIGSMPYEAENMVMAHVNGRIFVGLGETSDGVIQDNWYKIED